MTHLTESRDALAKALREIPVVWETETHKAVKFLLDHDDAEFVADALIASGAVIAVDTLADAMERRLRHVREFGERGSAYYNGAAHMLRAFAALTARSQ